MSMQSAFPGLATLDSPCFVTSRDWGLQSYIWLPMTFVRILCHPGTTGTCGSHFCLLCSAMQVRSLISHIAIFGIS